MWLFFALFGYACLAVVSILDKFILSKEKVSPTVFVFYSTVFLFPLAVFIPWLTPLPSPLYWILVLIGASAFVFSLWAMYLAFQKSEISHSGPLIGALVPLLILVLSGVFLGETIQPTQIFGIILLSIGTLTIAIQKKKPHHDFWQTIKFAGASAFFFAIFHVTAKSLYSEFGFSHGFFYLWGTVGVIGLSLYLSKNVREVIFPEHNFWQIFISKILHKNTTRLQIVTVVADKVLSALGVFLIQYAVSIGSVTKVNALNGFQYGLLIVLVASLTKFSPKLFAEHYQAGEFKRELFAVLIIAVGLVYLVK